MDPHPDFADCELPRQAALQGFRLTPLGPGVVGEDFEAVTASADLLEGLFGDDWPRGLTLEENAIDLAWHEREFTSRRSFAWVVRDPVGTYVACAYLYPALGQRGSAKVVAWVRAMDDRHAVATRLRAELETWLPPLLPDGIDLSWRTSPEV